MLVCAQWWRCTRFREGEWARSDDEDEDEDEDGGDEEEEEDDDDSDGDLLPELELDEDENDELDADDADDADDEDSDEDPVDEADDEPVDEHEEELDVELDEDPDGDPCSLSSFFCSSFFLARSCAFLTDLLSLLSIFRMFFRYSSNSARSCWASTTFPAPSLALAGNSSKNSLLFSFIAFSSLCVREGRERYTPSFVHWYVQ